MMFLSKKKERSKQEIFEKLERTWVKLFQTYKEDDLGRRLFLAFTKEYFEQECRSLENFQVVTNFVGYAKMVGALADTALKFIEKGNLSRYKIQFFTMLGFPLIKWFNFCFRDVGMTYPFYYRFYKVHPVWEAYKNKLNELKEMPQVELRRLAACNKKRISGSRFIAESELYDMLNTYYILLSNNKGSGKWNPKPFKQKDIRDILEKLDTKPRNELENAYKNVNEAYIILSKENFDNIPPIPLEIKAKKYSWYRLKDVFLYAYHRPIGRAFIIPFSQGDYDDWFGRPELKDRMPDDFFAIGIGSNPKDAEWLFILAAKIDPEAEKLSLEFTTPMLNKERHDKISNFFIPWLIENSDMMRKKNE